MISRQRQCAHGRDTLHSIIGQRAASAKFRLVLPNQRIRSAHARFGGDHHRSRSARAPIISRPAPAAEMA